MIIYLGADHRGFELKEVIKGFLIEKGYAEVFDLGNKVRDENDDYVDFAIAVGREISKNPAGSRGILLCGSGAGMDFVVNKFAGVRSVLAISSDQIFDARRDDDVNVLSISADATDPDEVKKFVQIFLSTPFSREERHLRRLEKLSELEGELYK